MPMPWVTPPPQILAKVEKPPIIQQIDEDLVVTAPTQSIDPINETITFSNGVTARYGVTTVTAEQLVVRMAEGQQNATATGRVHLQDPDGTLDADNLTFTWKPGSRSAHAQNVVARVAGGTIQAGVADLTEGHWEFSDVSVTVCRENPPLFALTGGKIVVTPGKRAKIERAGLEVFGARILTWPSYTLNLDPRTQGIRPPSLTYRKQDGIGIHFDNGWLLDESTALSTTATVFRRSEPSYAVQLGHSFLPPDIGTQPIVPRSDLREQFVFGYLDNIQVRSPEGEQSFLAEPRNNIGVGTYWNQGAAMDRRDVHYTKSVDVAYERGGDFGEFKAQSQVRLQRIREAKNPYIDRLAWHGTVGLEPKRLSNNLESLVRMDAAAFAGGNGFGWGRALVGATYQPLPQVRIGGGFFVGREFGSPDLPIDQLFAQTGFEGRIDFDLGPTQLSYLTKYDTRRKWFDQQYYVSQVVGCLEPYLIYRQFQGEYRFGINLRVDRFFELLQRRGDRLTSGAAR